MKFNQRVCAARWLAYKNSPKMVQTKCCTVGQELVLGRTMFFLAISIIFGPLKRGKAVKSIGSPLLNKCSSLKDFNILVDSVKYVQNTPLEKEEHNTIQISKLVMCCWVKK